MDDLESQIAKTLDHIQQELAGIRGGRAHPALVEEVKVKAYESQMRLRDVASITVPEPKVLEVRVWDATITDAVASALEQSDLGTSPNVAGDVIRIALPPLTDDRRMQLDKLVGSLAEEGRIALRSERDTALDRLKRLKTAGEISEDEFFRQKDVAEELIKDANSAIEELKKAKEQEIGID